MRTSARAVVIGGGVGGCSILYWLARLGWDDAVLVERADLTSGSTFHSAGLVGQLRSSLSLTDDDGERRSLPHARERGRARRPAGVRSGRCVSPRRRSGWRRSRQAGWAKTFGLPLELLSPAGHRLFPPMSVDGVLGAAYLPTDRYIDPSQLTFALAAGARGAGTSSRARASPGSAERGRVTGVETDRGSIETRGRRQRRRDVRGRDRRARGGDCQSSRWRTSTSCSSRRGFRRHADDARPLAARLLPARVRRADHGGYERNCAPWSLDGIPPTSTGSCSRRTGRDSRS